MANSQHKSQVLRHPVTFTAELLGSDGCIRAVQVENFSLGGCCVRHYATEGERLSIKIPQIGRFDAEVRWGRLGRSGLRFRRGT